MSQNRIVGILSRLDLDWLDVAAAQVADGSSPEDVRNVLFKLLKPVLAGGEKRGSACYKTVTVLARVWSTVPVEAEGIRDRAINLLSRASQQDRIALHWAMLSASYPFWADVGATVGKLLAIQGEVVLSQLTRRMTETWGDRSTVKRSSQRIVRSMVRWGTLSDLSTPGIYGPAKQQIKIGPAISEVLAESVLMNAEAKSIAIDQVRRHPSLFPFSLTLSTNKLRDCARFEVHRQGLDVDVVQLVEG